MDNNKNNFFSYLNEWQSTWNKNINKNPNTNSIIIQNNVSVAPGSTASGSEFMCELFE